VLHQRRQRLQRHLRPGRPGLRYGRLYQGPVRRREPHPERHLGRHAHPGGREGPAQQPSPGPGEGGQDRRPRIYD